MKIRPARFQGRRLIEITPASYEQIRELRETALVNIIQNSRSRFFLPENEDAARETLEKVLKVYPPVYLLKDEGQPRLRAKYDRFNRQPSGRSATRMAD